MKDGHGVAEATLRGWTGQLLETASGRVAGGLQVQVPRIGSKYRLPTAGLLQLYVAKSGPSWVCFEDERMRPSGSKP